MIPLLVSAKLAAMVELWGLVLCPSMIGSGIFSLRPQDAAACHYCWPCFAFAVLGLSTLMDLYIYSLKKYFILDTIKYTVFSYSSIFYIMLYPL
jgi:hypothetical protein